MLLRLYESARAPLGRDTNKMSEKSEKVGIDANKICWAQPWRRLSNPCGCRFQVSMNP